MHFSIIISLYWDVVAISSYYKLLGDYNSGSGYKQLAAQNYTPLRART